MPRSKELQGPLKKSLGAERARLQSARDALQSGIDNFEALLQIVDLQSPHGLSWQEKTVKKLQKEGELALDHYKKFLESLKVWSGFDQLFWTFDGPMRSMSLTWKVATVAPRPWPSICHKSIQPVYLPASCCTTFVWVYIVVWFHVHRPGMGTENAATWFWGSLQTIHDMVWHGD